MARAVGKSELEKIYNCIHHTIQTLGYFMNFKIGELKLKESMFGIDRMLHPSVTTNHILTTSNVVMDPRPASTWPTRQPVTGHWGVPVPPQHRAVTTVSENRWAEQSFNHQSTKRMRVAEAVPATQSRGPIPLHQQAMATGPTNLWAEQSFDHQPTKRMRVAEVVPTQSRGPGWGEPRWTQGWDGALTGGWGGSHGSASMVEHHQRSQEMQPARGDPWGRMLQQPPYGTFFATA